VGSLAWEGWYNLQMASEIKPHEPLDYFRWVKKGKKESPKGVLEVSRFILQNAEDEVLLLRRAQTSIHYPDFYELPGGKIQPPESATSGGLREVAEETQKIGLLESGDDQRARDLILEESPGWPLQHQMRFDAGHPYTKNTPYHDYSVRTKIFKAQVANENVMIDRSEHSEFVWMSPERAIEVLQATLTPYTRFALEALIAERQNKDIDHERKDKLPKLPSSISPTLVQTTAQIGDSPTGVLG